MLDLTFGEQVKIVLSRKGMTIKELAEIIEERTGKKMSRQNLTQRLGRDNFQEQDMRMIAEILGCPFQLSILADINAVERANNIETVEPTEKELSKLSRAKERKEERKEKRVEAHEEKHAKQREEKPKQRYIVAGQNKTQEEDHEREVTVGELVEIYEEPVIVDAEPEVVEAVVVEEPEEVVEEVVETFEVPQEEAVMEEQEEILEEPVVEEVLITDLLNEIDEIEKERAAERVPVVQPVEKQEEKKSRGWRAMFQRRQKKEEQEYVRPVEEVKEEPVEIAEEAAEPVEEIIEEVVEEPVYEEQNYYLDDDYIDYESTEEPEEVEEVVEEDPEEDMTVGEINPYTGREYESNSVRMHPKRIGYVQVYDRSDHQWTDMTEWAFLGYQERKKALLGKDYEPPIYLD